MVRVIGQLTAAIFPLLLLLAASIEAKALAPDYIYYRALVALVVAVVCLRSAARQRYELAGWTIALLFLFADIYPYFGCPRSTYTSAFPPSSP